MLTYGGNGRRTSVTKTERASNLTLSQRVSELAIRLTEKESLTLFLSDGISLPPDDAKISIYFEIRRSLKQFILQK